MIPFNRQSSPAYEEASVFPPAPHVAAVVQGIGASLPERIVTNDEVGARIDVTADWITQRTGIKQRHHIGSGTATGDLATEAGRAACESAGGEPPQAVIVATTTPDHLCPATAPQVAARLDLDQVAAFDLAAGCSGFVYSLAVGAGLIRAGTVDRVLVIGADTFTTIVDPHDRSTAPIFGDGAGAVVLRAGEPGEPGALGFFDLGSDGANSSLLYTPCGARRRSAQNPPEERDQFLIMQGRNLFRHAVHRMTESSLKVVQRARWQVTDVDTVVPHQANSRISAEVIRRLGIPAHRCLSNIAQVGNTAAASIPLLLHQAMETGALASGQRVLLTSFGSGLTWASTTLVWPSLSGRRHV